MKTKQAMFLYACFCWIFTNMIQINRSAGTESYWSNIHPWEHMYWVCNGIGDHYQSEVLTIMSCLRSQDCLAIIPGPDGTGSYTACTCSSFQQFPTYDGQLWAMFYTGNGEFYTGNSEFRCRLAQISHRLDKD